LPNTKISCTFIILNLKNLNLELKPSIEVALFCSQKAISLLELSKRFSAPQKVIEALIKDLQKDYLRRESTGLELIETSKDQYWLGPKKEYLSILQENLEFPKELKPNVLKTLALIFFQAPVSQARLIKIRGSIAYDHLKTLKKLNWINKKDYKNTYLIQLTEEFKSYFELSKQGEKLKKQLEKTKKLLIPKLNSE